MTGFFPLKISHTLLAPVPFNRLVWSYGVNLTWEMSAGWSEEVNAPRV